jgi:hypothetical protein
MLVPAAPPAGLSRSGTSRIFSVGSARSSRPSGVYRAPSAHPEGVGRQLASLAAKGRSQSFRIVLSPRKHLLSTGKQSGAGRKRRGGKSPRRCSALGSRPRPGGATNRWSRWAPSPRVRRPNAVSRGISEVFRASMSSALKSSVRCTSRRSGAGRPWPSAFSCASAASQIRSAQSTARSASSRVGSSRPSSSWAAPYSFADPSQAASSPCISAASRKVARSARSA